MKKCILLALLVPVSLALVGCGKEDSKPLPPAQSCSDFVRSRGYSDWRATDYCDDSQTTDCMNHMVNAGHDMGQAATYCMHGVSSTCLSSKMNQGYSAWWASQECRAGR